MVAPITRARPDVEISLDVALRRPGSANDQSRYRRRRAGSGFGYVRVFVSSPGDTIHERGRVDRVVERLNGEFAATVRLETIRWETEFYRAHATFQAQIPESADCDIVIAVFRHRIGTELSSTFARLPDGSPYPAAPPMRYCRRSRPAALQGHPDVYVFRYPNPPMVRLDDPETEQTQEQWQRLKAVFRHLVRCC